MTYPWFILLLTLTGTALMLVLLHGASTGADSLKWVRFRAQGQQPGAAKRMRTTVEASLHCKYFLVVDHPLPSSADGP
jgi:hypothetical protein